MKENTNKTGTSPSELIYRTPMIYVLGAAAAAAIAFCLIVALIMFIIGFGFVSSETVDGNTVNYYGIMRDGTPTFGWLCDSDGKSGFVSGNMIKYSDGSKYEGGLVGFYYDGEGRYTDSRGNVYTGSFSWGKLNGSVHVDYADGGSFDGEYLDGKRHGHGTEIFTDGHGLSWGYVGEYANGEKNGYGVLTYQDGSSYKGNFKNGMKHGDGFYRFATGDTYTGEFRNNVINGTGTYFFSSGRVFSGEFRNGVPVLE